MKKTLLSLLVLAQTGVFAQGSMNMDSLFNWQDPTLPASTAHNNTYNEIWGYAKDGREYAIIGSTAGAHIFDVTDPSISTEVAFVEGAVTGTSVIHRHFHDYQDYLYLVCDEGPSTLQIADLRFLPDSAPVVYDSDEFFPRAHNIFIDTASARLYVCGGTMLFAVYSLADPTAPTLLLDCPNDVPFWSSIGYVHDVFVRGDTAYLNSETRGLFVVDFSNISNPQMIGSLDAYPQQGYNHSGYLMPDQPYYAFADETHGMDVKILDVSDMSNLVLTDTITTGIHEFTIPHNLLYHEHFLYISYYFDGVYVFDCSDPAHPELAAFYDTSTEEHQNHVYRGCWGVYPFLPSGNILASDMQTGLWVLRANLPSGIEEQGRREVVSVFPNPANDRLHFSENLQRASYSIVNMMGSEVQRGQVSTTVDVASLPTGVYTILLNEGDKESVGRFVKQ